MPLRSTVRARTRAVATVAMRNRRHRHARSRQVVVQTKAAVEPRTAGKSADEGVFDVAQALGQRLHDAAGDDGRVVDHHREAPGVQAEQALGFHLVGARVCSALGFREEGPNAKSQVVPPAETARSPSA